MSRERQQERASELARLWQGSVVPVDDADKLDARAERITAALGDAIERASAGKKRERGRTRLFGALAVAAGLALVAGTGLTFSAASESAAVGAAPAADVRAVAGVVTLHRDARPAVVEHAALEAGDRVTTAAGAEAEVDLAGLVVAKVGGASDVGVHAPRGATRRLRLDRGHLHARVDDRPSQVPKLVVETPDVEVVVTGTVFQVGVTLDPASAPVTDVSVTRGHVEIRKHGAVVARLTAGQAWSSRPEPEPPATPAAAPAEPPPVATAAPAAARSAAGTLAAQNALFQAAAEARKRGSHGVAAELLGELLSSYPRSPFAAEARIERMRAFERLGRTNEAGREARRYLADFPAGYARDEAERILAPTDPAE